MKIKDMKIGTWFTRKPIEHPKGSQVYIRSGYDRSSRKYECIRWDDINKSIWLKGDTEVNIDFIF